jgi:plasmid stabilization system protein ParE
VKRKLLIRPSAHLDVVAQYSYVLTHSPKAAAKFRQAIKAGYKRIRRDCRSCATLSFKRFEGLEIRFYRPRGFPNHLIVFQVTDDSIRLLRVLHGSQT